MISKGIRILAVATAAMTFGVGGAVALSNESPDRQAHYCAYFPDSVGLYVGNPVTQMGYGLGEVTDIEPQGDRVLISFDVAVDRPFPADVKAVIRSKSLLADRSLELVGNYDSGPELEENGCIALENTATPKSLSEITGSASDFLQTLTAGDTDSIATAVTGLDEALKGQGDDINRLLGNAAGAMSSPDQMVADVGSIVTDLAPFTTTTLENWTTAKQLLAVLPEDLAVASDGLWGGVSTFIHGLAPLLAVLLDMQTNYGGDINAILGTASVGLHVAATSSGDIGELLAGIPVLADLIRTDASVPALQIASPQVSISVPDPPTLCAAVNNVRPTSCSVDGNKVLLSNLGMLDAVLAGAR